MEVHSVSCSLLTELEGVLEQLYTATLGPSICFSCKHIIETSVATVVHEIEFRS